MTTELNLLFFHLLFKSYSYWNEIVDYVIITFPTQDLVSSLLQQSNLGLHQATGKVVHITQSKSGDRSSEFNLVFNNNFHKYYTNNTKDFQITFVHMAEDAVDYFILVFSHQLSTKKVTFIINNKMNEFNQKLIFC